MTNTIIRASAGSGKTFQLSNRYLDIVFRNEPVESILASTFTRKAAGEILSRILMRLAKAALDDTERQSLADFVTLPEPIRLVSHGGSPAVLETEAETLQRLLADLARNLFRLRISTLDSFFNKIATSFSLEFGLPPGWSILDETDHARLIGEAVRNVLDDSARNEARKLMNMLQKGEQDRNVTRELCDLATQLLPIVRESPPKAWDHQERLAKTELDEKTIAEILEHLERAELPQTKGTKSKPGKDNSNFVKVRETLRVRAVNEEWNKFLESSLVQSVIAGDCLYYKIPVEGTLLHCVRELIQQAHAKIVNKLVAQTKATRSLLDLIAEAYDKILLRERQFRFEDITARLGSRDFSSTLEVLNHRMDARTSHLLLDEFQDTSMPQWNVIQSFATDVAKNAAGSFFCVGDVKQAIYAWRGGEAEIFNTIENAVFRDAAIDVELKPLNVSFRSSPIVIGTVNELFRNIASNAALEPKHPEAAQAWQDRFEEHDVSKKNKTLPGHCILEVAPEPQGMLDEADERLPDDDGEENENIDKEEMFLRYTVDRIRTLHETRPGLSIGVLVARNKKIGPIIARLKSFGIEASEEGGNPLTDSAAVQHILSAMILADHPGDRIARFHLAHGPLSDLLNLTEHDNAGQAVRASFWLRRQLIEKGYGSLVEELAQQLAPSCNPREFQRLEKLQELAFRFQETDHGVRTRRFVEVIRQTKVESPTASPIRVMTIHKSKGLEFDIVVLPDLEKTLSRGTPLVVTDRKSPADPIHMAIRYIGEDVQALLPEDYQRAFKLRVQKEVEESLSLLYVAMTRAVHELVMIVAPLGKSAKRKEESGTPSYPATFAGVLRAGLTAAELPPDATVLYETIGGHEWFENLKSQDVSEKKRLEPEFLDCSLAPKPTLPRRNLPRVTPSSLELKLPSLRDTSGHSFDGSGGGWKVEGDASEKTPTTHHQPPTTTQGRSREDAMLRGTAVHACFDHAFRENPWIDEAVLDAEFLEEIVRKAVMGEKGTVEPKEIVAEFSAACQRPGVRAALSRSAYPSDAEVSVEHERRFAVRLDEGKILRGSVDRLVVIKKAGKIVGLDIIDYKTDQPEKDGDVEVFVADRKKIYTPQLAAYRNGMARLFRLDENAITTKLLFVAIDRLVEVPAE